MPAEGRHIATFQSYEDIGETPNRFEHGKMQHQMKLTFLIGEMKQFAWVTASLNDKSTFFKIAKALLGKKPDGEFEVDDFLGLRCQVEIERYENNKGQKRAKISGYYPAPRDLPQ